MEKRLLENVLYYYPQTKDLNKSQVYFFLKKRQNYR